MKKKWLFLYVYMMLCCYVYSFDLNSIKSYLGADFSLIKEEFPNILFTNNMYHYQFSENGIDYAIFILLLDNKVYGIAYVAYLNNHDEAFKLFNNVKTENLIIPGGRLIVNNNYEYMWIYSNSIITQITMFNENGRHSVTLFFLSNW